MKDSMNGYERISNILKRRPVDRIGVFEHFWPDTQKSWADKGHINENENLSDHFGLDMEMHWSFNMIADINFENKIVEETDETILIRDGNGALLRRHKLHDSTPEHVDFLVKSREEWEKHIKHKLVPDPERISFEGYRSVKEHAKRKGKFFCWCGVNVFELMHPVCGHEHMLAGMALDPEWIMDMVDTYSDLTVKLQEMLFEKEGYPDGIWYYEDMGYKGTPFFSADMYKEIIQPGHKKTIEFAHSKDIPVIMHSCGMIEPLLPGMIESGIDCLQVIEVKAGMDLLRIYEKYGSQIALMGGIDVRKLYTNEKQEIEKELMEKIPKVMKGFGYVLHSDHSIPKTVDYDIFKFYLEKGMEIGRY